MGAWLFPSSNSHSGRLVGRVGGSVNLSSAVFSGLVVPITTVVSSNLIDL